ncbi:MAG: hypothetical protein IJF17_06785 [Thermoguttaceae bacterium]|nr:hypothetical protein [Thermoguttaceae bacterium]
MVESEIETKRRGPGGTGRHLPKDRANHGFGSCSRISTVDRAVIQFLVNGPIFFTLMRIPEAKV